MSFSQHNKLPPVNPYATPHELREAIAMRDDMISDLLGGGSKKIYFPIHWKLTGSEDRMLRFLYASRGLRSKEVIYRAVFQGPDGDGPAVKIVDVFLCKLRRKTRPHGIEIVTEWGEGMYLTKASLHALDDMRSQQVAS